MDISPINNNNNEYNLKKGNVTYEKPIDLTMKNDTVEIQGKNNDKKKKLSTAQLTAIITASIVATVETGAWIAAVLMKNKVDDISGFWKQFVNVCTFGWAGKNADKVKNKMPDAVSDTLSKESQELEQSTPPVNREANTQGPDQSALPGNREANTQGSGHREANAQGPDQSALPVNRDKNVEGPGQSKPPTNNTQASNPSTTQVNREANAQGPDQSKPLGNMDKDAQASDQSKPLTSNTPGSNQNTPLTSNTPGSNQNTTLTNNTQGSNPSIVQRQSDSTEELEQSTTLTSNTPGSDPSIVQRQSDSTEELEQSTTSTNNTQGSNPSIVQRQSDSTQELDQSAPPVNRDKNVEGPGQSALPVNRDKDTQASNPSTTQVNREAKVPSVSEQKLKQARENFNAIFISDKMPTPTSALGTLTFKLNDKSVTLTLSDDNKTLTDMASGLSFTQSQTNKQKVSTTINGKEVFLPNIFIGSDEKIMQFNPNTGKYTALGSPFALNSELTKNFTTVEENGSYIPLYAQIKDGSFNLTDLYTDKEKKVNITKENSIDHHGVLYLCDSNNNPQFLPFVLFNKAVYGVSTNSRNYYNFYNVKDLTETNQLSTTKGNYSFNSVINKLYWNQRTIKTPVKINDDSFNPVCDKLQPKKSGNTLTYSSNGVTKTLQLSGNGENMQLKTSTNTYKFNNGRFVDENNANVIANLWAHPETKEFYYYDPKENVYINLDNNEKFVSIPGAYIDNDGTMHYFSTDTDNTKFIAVWNNAADSEKNTNKPNDVLKINMPDDSEMITYDNYNYFAVDHQSGKIYNVLTGKEVPKNDDALQVIVEKANSAYVPYSCSSLKYEQASALKLKKNPNEVKSNAKLVSVEIDGKKQLAIKHENGMLLDANWQLLFKKSDQTNPKYFMDKNGDTYWLNENTGLFEKLNEPDKKVPTLTDDNGNQIITYYQNHGTVHYFSPLFKDGEVYKTYSSFDTFEDYKKNTISKYTQTSFSPNMQFKVTESGLPVGYKPGESKIIQFTQETINKIKEDGIKEVVPSNSSSLYYITRTDLGSFEVLPFDAKSRFLDDPNVEYLGTVKYVMPPTKTNTTPYCLLAKSEGKYYLLDNKHYIVGQLAKNPVGNNNVYVDIKDLKGCKDYKELIDQLNDSNSSIQNSLQKNVIKKFNKKGYDDSIYITIGSDSKGYKSKLVPGTHPNYTISEIFSTKATFHTYDTIEGNVEHEGLVAKLNCNDAKEERYCIIDPKDGKILCLFDQ